MNKCFLYRHRDAGDFDPPVSNVSGAHTVCLFGFCPNSDTNTQMHYIYTWWREGVIFKSFDMSTFKTLVFPYQNSAV